MARSLALCVVVLLVASARAANVVAPDQLPAGQPVRVAVLDATPGLKYSWRLVDSSDELRGVQSNTVTADKRLVQLEENVGVEAGEWLLEVLEEGETREGKVLLSKQVEVEEPKPWLFLETDKPVYKAGSTIRVRVLCLMPDLTSCPDSPAVRILLKNPDNFKVFAVQATSQNGVGVLEGSLVLDERAPLGTYVVAAEGLRDTELLAEMEVTVDEYVLPKFEVTVTPTEQFLLPGSKSLSGVVSATYSYGEHVQGTAVIKASMEQDCYSGPWFGGISHRGRAARRPPIYSPKECGYVVLAQENITEFSGMHQFELSLEDADLSGWNKKVELSVSVTEAATGTQLNSTATIPVERSQESKVTVSNPKRFQPGLPIPLTVESLNPDGSPDDGQFLVSLTFRSNGWRVRHQETKVEAWLTTQDGKGTIELQAPRNLPCCMDAVERAALADDSLERELEKLFGPESCCWGTVVPEVNRGNGTNAVIRASTEYGSCMEPVYPPRHSYLSVRAEPEREGVRELELLFTQDIRGKDVAFMITSSNGLISSGNVDTDNFTFSQEDGFGRGMLSVALSDRMIPEASVLVAYTSDDGELIADETSFEVDLSLRSSQSVEMEIKSVEVNDDRDYVVPGERVQIKGRADPGSLLFLGAVDRSVSFLSDKNTRVSTSRICSALQSQMRRDEDMPDAWGPPSPEKCWHIGAFAAAGLSLDLSQASQRDRHLCFIGRERTYYSLPTCGGGGWGGPRPFPIVAMPMMAFSAVSRVTELADDVSIASASERGTRTKRREQRTLRQAFPETWVWATADVDSNGNAVMFSAIPDTITTWDVSGFALGAQTGLGLPSGQASIRVFKPLFVQLKLPYKVVRGEVLEVVMTVFNYLSEAQNVALVLEGRGGAHVPLEAANQQLTIGPNSAASRTAMLTFDTVGTATLRLSGVGGSATAQDAVQRTLKVVPEGVQQSSTVSVMLQPSEEPGGIQELTLPAHNRTGTGAVVPGSLYTRLTLSGDLMGPSLEGLDSLVRLPTGCGEQNMVLMAPNVYIINYLTAKRDLRSSLRDRALGFIQTGYSRELQYRHSDGSFSAFGERDDSGSTWLTAFVLKVFSQAHAAELIDVDASIASEAAMWLVSHQAEDGSFANVGRVIHSDMMGGNGDDPESGDLALTAFVTTALLEARSAGLWGGMETESLQAGLAYLQAKLQQNMQLSRYASVLSLHALTLAHTQRLGDAIVGGSAVDMLQDLAIRDGTFTHWAPRDEGSGAGKREKNGRASRRSYTVAEASGPEVEMTGYALHAMVLAQEGLAEGLPTVRWLLSERSETGGWKSTQDTIVALEGLAAYAAEVSAVPPEMTINLGSHQIMLNADNADVVQHLNLSPGAEVAIRAQGLGMAVLTVTTAWHSTASPEAPALELSGEVSVNKDGVLQSRVTLVRSKGPGQSGMMVAEIGMFSGYVASPSSLAALEGACGGLVKRVETPLDGRVLVYLDELPVGKVCEMGVEQEQEVRVDNIQAAPVEAYYYYTPDRRGSAFLHPPVQLNK